MPGRLARRTATSSSSARTPRAPTPARAGSSRKGTPFEVATQGSVNTRHGRRALRPLRLRPGLAPARPSPHPGAQDQRAHLRRRPVAADRRRGRAPSTPASTRDYNHVDAACIYLVEQPDRYDVIVTDNLFGDILTDLAGAVAGGIGFAASANLNPARTGPSLFEPVHGAAHDIAGTGQANPAGRHPLGRPHARPPRRGRRGRAGHQGGHRLPIRASGPDRRSARPPSPSATPSQKGSEPVPITPTEKIWMDGELVDWDDARSTCSPTPCTTARASSRASAPTRRSRGVAVFRLRDHIDRLFTSAKVFMIDVPFTVDELVEATKEVVRVNGLDDGCYIRPIVYLGLRRDGPQPAAVPGQRVHRRLAVGHLPRRRGRGQRRPAEGQLVAAPRPQRRADRGQGDGHVRQLLAGQGRGAQGRLRRGHPAGPGRPSVSECTGENIFIVRDGRLITPPTSDSGALEGITQDSVRDHRPRPRLRGAPRAAHPHRPLHRRRGLPDRHRGRGRADPRGRRPRRSAPGSPGPITKQIQETYFATVRGEVDQYKDWLEHVE